MPTRKRPLALLLALPILLTLFASPAGAVPLDRALPDLFARGWAFLLALWAEEGCSLDPHGRCGISNAPVPILSEAGCEVDPHGGCRTAGAPAPILREGGCSLDPNGRCGQ